MDQYGQRRPDIEEYRLKPTLAEPSEGLGCAEAGRRLKPTLAQPSEGLDCAEAGQNRPNATPAQPNEGPDWAELPPARCGNTLREHCRHTARQYWNLSVPLSLPPLCGHTAGTLHKCGRAVGTLRAHCGQTAGTLWAHSKHTTGTRRAHK